MDAASFSPQDAEAIFGLAEKLTGNSVRGKLMLANVARRVAATGCRNLFEYLRLIEERSDELPFLISGLVVHTTSWFREEPHFSKLSEWLEPRVGRFKDGHGLRALSAACSTGEEAYSLAMVLESFRERYSEFDYQVDGRDIDLLCVKQGSRAVYPTDDMPKVPREHRQRLLEGGGETQGLFTVADSIRHRVEFSAWNLVRLDAEAEKGWRYDVIFCRNVLIYFTPENVERVVRRLLSMLRPDGILCLGHSEAIDASKFGVESQGNSTYLRPARPLPGTELAPRHGTVVPGGGVSQTHGALRTVLVVDDSASVRRMITRLLEGTEFRAEPVASALEATEYLRTRSADLVTLDLHMPGMDGQSWLVRQRREGLKTPVVVVSDDLPSDAALTFGALESGAQDYFHKGQLLTGRGELLERFRQLVDAAMRPTSEPGLQPVGELRLRRPELILVGASVGGPEALVKLLSGLPHDLPPLLVCQHITPDFSGAFGEHLAQAAGLRRPRLSHGMPLEPGSLYIAEGDYHIGARRFRGSWNLVVSDAPPVRRHRPSIDFLFSSPGADSGCERVFAAILTGMGADGAEGLLRLRQAGAMTFAQERNSCVVFGMPKEALRLGAVSYSGTPADIRRQLDLSLRMPDSNSGSNASSAGRSA